MIKVKIEKLKMDYEELKDKSWKEKIKTSFVNIQKVIFNNTKEVMQETLLNGYYFNFFKKLKKEVLAGEHINIKSVEFVENKKNVLRVNIDFVDVDDKENGLKLLEWCLYDITFKDAFTRAGKEKKLDKIESKMSKNFVDSVQKQSKGQRINFGKVKDYFRGVWSNNVNKSLSDVCLNYSVGVVYESINE